jgi:hypothetical protein
MSETRTNKKTEDAAVTGNPVVIANTPQEPEHEQIAALAYELWIERGSPHGSHEEDWHRAESQLREKPITKAAGA